LQCLLISNIVSRDFEGVQSPLSTSGRNTLLYYPVLDVDPSLRW
jgi:hypothetical protein